MTTTQAADILAAHNRWRRHDGEYDSDEVFEMPHPPKVVGEAIDNAVTRLRKLDYWQNITDAQMRQMMGELSAQDIRNIRAALSAI